MCGKNSTTTSTSTPNPQALGVYSNLLNQAGNVAQLPFQQYGGEFVAPVNQQEQLAGQNINANAGFAQPYIQQAAGYANQAAQPITAQQIQNYENPYINQVVGATEAQFNQQNAQQQQQLTGNAAAQNALGGDRVGLAQAALAGQQQTQEAPVIAGLYSQGYSQAEQEALAEQQQQAQAAYSLGNLGVAGQNAALQGAGAQLGYGQLGQQTQQALDTALYNQFLAQQGYPFQTLGWEAGLATGVGSQMGGTNVTQGPQPNPLSQYGGLALAGVGLLSDRDAKTDITKIGELKDGQSIYRYRYKGDPKWQIGLVAQNVERRHPEAVHREPGFGGLRSIDVKAATDDAARRDHGGRIANCGRPIAGFAMGGTPYSSLNDGASAGYVPSIQITPGNTMPKGPSGSGQQQQTNPIQSANSILGLNKSLSNFGSTPIGKFFGNMDVSTSDAQLAGMQSGLDPSEVGVGDADAFHSGGRIAGLAAGGGPTPEFADGGGPDNDWASGDMPIPPEPAAGLAGPEYSPVSIAGGTAQPAAQAFNGSLAGDSAAGQPTPVPAPQRTAGVSWANPTPASAYGYAPNLQTIETGGGHRATVNSQAAPAFKGFLNDLEKAGAPISDIGGYNYRNIAGTHTLSPHASGDAIDVNQTGRNLVTPEMQAWRDAHPGVFSQLASKWGLTSGENWKNPDFGHVEWRGANGQMASVGAPQATPQEQAQAQKPQGGLLGFNPLGLSDNARMALVAAGLGMAASRSPYLGNAIGEGGLAGLQAYQAGTKREFDENLAQKKLDQAAEASRQKIAHESKLEQHSQDQIDIARQRLGLEQTKATPEYAKTMADARRAANPYDDETLDTMARQYLSGDKSVTVGLGRNPEAMGAFRQKVNQVMRDYGISPEEQAAKQAEIQGDFASVKQLSVMGGKIDYAINEASKTFPMLLDASKNVPRSNLTDWNKLEQLVQSHTSSPELARLHTAIRATVTAYTQAMARSGQMTVHGDEESQKLLNAAMGHGSMEAIIDQMNKEMQAAKGAALQTTEERLGRIRQPLSQRGQGQGQPAATAAPAAAPAGGGAPTVVGQVRQNGHIYNKMSDGSYQPVQ